MGAASSTVSVPKATTVPVPTLSTEKEKGGQLQIVNSSGVNITVKIEGSVKILTLQDQQTGTLVLPSDFKSDIIIYGPGGKVMEKITLDDLLTAGLNPVVYIKPGVQILSSDSLVPRKKSDSRAAQELAASISGAPSPFTTRPVVNVTPIN